MLHFKADFLDHSQNPHENPHEFNGSGVPESKMAAAY